MKRLLQKNLLLFGVILTFGSFLSNAQLTTVSVTTSDQEGVDAESGMPGYFLTVNISIDDQSDLSEVSVIILDDATDLIAAMFKMSKAELESNNLLNNNQITKDFFLMESGNYRIETSVRNSHSANLPKVITTHNM